MKASIKNYRQAPRKTRLIANLVRNKNLNGALVVLTHVKKRAAEPFKKLLESAAANAKEQGKNIDDLCF